MSELSERSSTGQRVRIVTDSACDLPAELADELGISIVPLTIRIGGEEFVDRVELDAEQFWAKCSASPTGAGCSTSSRR